MFGDILGCHDSGRRGVPGIYWTESRDAAKPPTVPRTAPQRSSDPKCHSAEVDTADKGTRDMSRVVTFA